MLPSKDRLDFLFEQYLNNRISEEDLRELFGYIRDAKGNDLLKEQMMQVFRKARPEEEQDWVDWEAMFSEIIKGPARHGKGRIRKLPLWSKVAAAVLIILLGSMVAFWFSGRYSLPEQVAQTGKLNNDILPGGNKAVLTLSNGKKIILNNANNGKLASAGNVNVMKVNNGLIVYKPGSGKQKAESKVGYNILATPRGGQYQLTLSDGTKVWLNAASSIRYPVAFTGKERVVQVTGEAYFEVAKNAAQPFMVYFSSPADGGREGAVEVLGTHFNVNAYADENKIKVTLLEGLIKVQSSLASGESEIVHPGQQIQMNEKGAMNLVRDADVDGEVSWKNGFFSFRNDNLVEVMKKLSRWYDVDVTYQPGIDNRQQFTGRIDRNLTLSQVLKGLELTNAHFKIEANRKLEILP